MNQLSKVIVANTLSLIAVLGLSFKVQAQVIDVKLLDNNSSPDGSGRAISQVGNDQITATAVAGADTFQLAQMYSQKERRHWGEGLKHFLAKLDLSDEQSTQIKAIYRRYFQANQQSRQELHQARAEMRSLLINDTNLDRLRRKHREIQRLNQQLGNSRFEAMLEVRTVLTPQQRREIAEMMTEYRGRRGYYHQ